MATLAEIQAWKGLVLLQQTAAQAKVTEEAAKPLPAHLGERRLQQAYRGHLRWRVAQLRALWRFLDAADVAVDGGGAHPAQQLSAPVFASGQMTIPKTPPRGHAV